MYSLLACNVTSRVFCLTSLIFYCPDYLLNPELQISCKYEIELFVRYIILYIILIITEDWLHYQFVSTHILETLTCT